MSGDYKVFDGSAWKSICDCTLKVQKNGMIDLDELKILIRGFDAWIDKAVKTHSKQCRYLLRDYVFTLIDTGARPGKELFDLKWKQVTYLKLMCLKVQCWLKSIVINWVMNLMSNHL